MNSPARNGLVLAAIFAITSTAPGAELRIVTEYRFPVEWQIVPVVQNFRGTVRTSYVAIPTEFESRDIGVILSAQGAVGPAVAQAAAAEGEQRRNLTTPLMLAASMGDTVGVRRLLYQGMPRLNQQNTWGSTALMGACAGGFTGTIDILLDAGADIHLRTRRGDSALSFAVRNGHVRATRILLKRGGKLTITTASGRTLLHEAVANGDEPMVRELLAHGADPNILDDSGRNAVALARQNQHGNLVVLLTRP